MKVWPILDQITKWEIGNGQNINVWLDYWIEPDIKLIDHPNLTIGSEENTKLETIVTHDGYWNWAVLTNNLPHELVERICTIDPPDLDSNEPDLCTWGGTKSGKFTVATTYC